MGGPGRPDHRQECLGQHHRRRQAQRARPRRGSGRHFLRRREAPRLNRSAITEIRLIAYAGNGRRLGKFVGRALGLAIGLGTGAAIGLREGSAFNDSDKVLAVTLMLDGFPAGLGLGYLVGRQADKETTVIRIIPQ
jgi:hypothetical protein